MPQLEKERGKEKYEGGEDGELMPFPIQRVGGAEGYLKYHQVRRTAFDIRPQVPGAASDQSCENYFLKCWSCTAFSDYLGSLPPNPEAFMVPYMCRTVTFL